MPDTHPYLAPGTVVRRDAEKIRYLMNRRVAQWYGDRMDAVGDRATREEIVETVFLADGWNLAATINDNTGVSNTRPMNGALFTHPVNGILIWADKPRDGDMGPDYVAPAPAGPWNRDLLVWAADVPDLMDESVQKSRSSGNSPDRWAHLPWPHHRVRANLVAHAYQTASVEDQETAAFLLALSGRNLDGYLGIDLSITSA